MTDTRPVTDPTVRELPLAAGGDLELRLGANRLRIRVVDGDRVVIRGRTDHDLERDVEITSGSGWVRITDGPAGSLRFGPFTMRSGGHVPDLEIDVPRGVRISARTLSGDIEAVGVAGPSRWQSASGSVRVGAEGGPLTIETVSGDALVDARAPLAVTARTVSGSVKIRAPRIQALDAATTSGNVTVDAALDPAVGGPSKQFLLAAKAAGLTWNVGTIMLTAIAAVLVFSALLYVIAFWAISTGIFEIIAGIRLRRVITNEWLLLVQGALSLLFGILILFAPGVGALAIVLWIGAYACVFGIALLALAFRLRGHQRLIAQPT